MLRVHPLVFAAYRIYWLIVIPTLLAKEIDWASLSFLATLLFQMFDMHLIVPDLTYFIVIQLSRIGSTIALTMLHLLAYYKDTEDDGRNPLIRGSTSAQQGWIIANYVIVLLFDFYSMVVFNTYSTMYRDEHHPHHYQQGHHLASHSSSSIPLVQFGSSAKTMTANEL